MAGELKEATNAAWTVREIGPWILGAASLAQVWVIGLWRRFRKGKIEIFESGLIEISYGQLGPSIGLIGTLRCLHKDIFVKRLRIKVKRQCDNAEFFFNWHAF